MKFKVLIKSLFITFFILILTPSFGTSIDETYGINPKAFYMAMKAYKWALSRGHVRNPGILTVVDMSKPSSEDRLFVIDLKRQKLLMALPVTNGKNSGTYYATRFSNKPGSLESSLGTYVTADTYQGEHGFSLRMHGLEKGINDNAFDRAIVIHAAWYASRNFIRDYGRAGGSWGCFAVDPSKAHKLINMIRGGTVLFAYAHQENSDPYINA